MLASALRSAFSPRLLVLGLLLMTCGRSMALQVPEPPPAPVASEPADEATLLRAFCRYLKLTGVQARRLALFAREASNSQTARRLQAEIQELRRLEALPPTAETERLVAEFRTSIKEQQSAVDRIAEFGTSALVRNLTREQIALIWRLTRGDPPQHSAIDPRLLAPSSGFATRHSRGTQLIRFSDEGLMLQRFQILPIDVQNLQGELDTTVRVVWEGAEPSSAGGKPFPQWVVESNNLDDFLPVVAPIGRRVFLSTEWKPVLESGAASGFAGRQRSYRTISSLPMVRLYRMENGLRDSLGRGPELISLGGVVRNGQYHFQAGQGIELPQSGALDHYAVQMDFRHFGKEGYQKLIDFKGRAKDGGLYLHEGRLTFYTLAIGPPVPPGVEHRLRLERNAGTRIVRVLLNYRPVFAFVDLDGEAAFEGGAAAFLADDRSTKGEEGPGTLSSLTVWAPAPAD